MNYQDFIKPELLILIPVLYFIGAAIAKSKVRNELIPLILGVCSVLLSGIYIFASTPLSTTQEIATAIFTAITQGVLCAGASVYANELLSPAEKSKHKNDEV